MTKSQHLGGEIVHYDNDYYTFTIVSESDSMSKGKNLALEIVISDKYLKSRQTFRFNGADELRRLARMFAEAADNFDEEDTPVSFLEEMPDHEF